MLVTFATCAEFTLIFVGLGLLWRLVLSPAARARRIPSPVPKWNAPLIDFLLFLWFVLAGAFLGQFLALAMLPVLGTVTANTRVIIAGAGFQGGMLAGCIAFRWGPWFRASAAPTWTREPVSILLAGIVTFLIAVPLVFITGVAWRFVLERFNINASPQELFDVFGNAKSPAPIILLIVIAAIIAPLSEEWIFRGSIFRYARGRLPRWAALVVPACLFGALHQNLGSFAPLVVLGVVFSLAYESTGSIAVPMVAHALFNLNSILLFYAGASDGQ
jgi:membrane protease YdiL (CAAX protease family)